MGYVVLYMSVLALGYVVGAKLRNKRGLPQEMPCISVETGYNKSRIIKRRILYDYRRTAHLSSAAKL